MPRLQEITFAEYAQSEIIPAGDSIETGHAGEVRGCHSRCDGSDGDNVDREEDAKVATAALGHKQPRALQAKGWQHSKQVRSSPGVPYLTGI